jgi:hypothetical protein
LTEAWELTYDEGFVFGVGKPVRQDLAAKHRFAERPRINDQRSTINDQRPATDDRRRFFLCGLPT